MKRQVSAAASLFATALAVCLFDAIASGQRGAPRKIRDVAPVYPRESLQAGDEGWIILELNVTDLGAVGDVRILGSSCKRLDGAALTAVRQWRYDPIRVNGKPMPFVVGVQIPFRLPALFKERAGPPGACKWTDPPKLIRVVTKNTKNFSHEGHEEHEVEEVRFPDQKSS